MPPETETITLDANGVRFAALSCGEGPLVLCLHGFPDTANTWADLLPKLADAGYRAVAPHMRGYAPTAVPQHGNYDPETLADDVFALAHALDARHFSIVGHDWGAVAAYAAAMRNTGRLRGIVAAAVPPLVRFLGNMRPAQIRRSWYMFFFQLPGVAEKRLARDDFALVERLWRDWSPNWHFSPADIAPVKQALAEPQARKAALGYYRALLPSLMRPARARRLLAGKMDVPAQVVAGRQDGCIGPDVFKGTADCFSGECDLAYMDAGHFMHREQPDAFNRYVLDFLGRHSPPAKRTAN